MKKRKLISFLGICLLILLFLPNLSRAEKVKLRVITDKASLRLKPVSGSLVISTLPLGAILESEEQIGEWFKVNLPPDEQGFVVIGFIHSSDVEVITEKQTIVEEWQTDPDAFARLFFGDDLSWELAKKRKPGGVFYSDEVTKAIVGAQVEWHGLVGNASSNAWALIFGSPLEIRVLFGPEKKYLIHITGSRREGEKEVDWKEMVKNIKPGTKVRVKLKTSRNPVAGIAKDRIYFIMLEGEALEIYPIN